MLVCCVRTRVYACEHMNTYSCVRMYVCVHVCVCVRAYVFVCGFVCFACVWNKRRYVNNIVTGYDGFCIYV